MPDFCHMHDLIHAWQEFSFTKLPRLLPGDEQLAARLSRVADYQNYEDFVASADFGSSSPKFHLNLFPQPFIGNLTQATIFVLLLNPGFSAGDYYALQHTPAYATAIQRNLTQQNGADAYPFFFLDPQFAWTAGGQWWQARFRSLTQELVDKADLSWQQALKHISRHVACLELYPYHSQHFSQPKIPLASTKLVRRYVTEVLVPRAIDGHALLVATRQAATWQLPKTAHPNIISYNAGQARGAHLTMNTNGGAAIIQRLKELALS